MFAENKGKKAVKTDAVSLEEAQNTSNNNTEAKEDDTLPAIVNADSIVWPENMLRKSKYNKYDRIKVGEAVMGLDRQIAETLRQRLKKKGFKILSCQMEDGTFAIRRVAPDVIESAVA